MNASTTTGWSAWPRLDPSSTSGARIPVASECTAARPTKVPRGSSSPCTSRPRPSSRRSESHSGWIKQGGQVKMPPCCRRCSLAATTLGAWSLRLCGARVCASVMLLAVKSRMLVSPHGTDQAGTRSNPRCEPPSSFVVPSSASASLQPRMPYLLLGTHER